MSKNIEVYKSTPLDVLNEENIRRRTPFEKPIRLNYIFPTSGKKFALYRKIRQHVMDITPFFSVLNEYELFTLEKEIRAGNVPLFFLENVTLAKRAKQEGFVIDQFVYGNGEKMPLFVYEDEGKLNKYHASPQMAKAVKLPKNYSSLMKSIQAQMGPGLKNLKTPQEHKSQG